MSEKRSLPARIFVLGRDFLGFARWRAATALLLVVSGTFLEGFGLVLLIPLLDVVTGKGLTPDSGLTASFASEILSALSLTTLTGQLFGITALFALVMVLRTIVVTMRQTVTTDLQLRYLAAKRTQVIDSLTGASWEQLAGLRHARITHLLGSDIHYIGSAAYGLIAVAVAALQILIYFIVAAFISLPLSLSAGILLAASALLARSLMRDAATAGAMVNTSHLNLFNDVAQFLGALKISMSQNLQRTFAGGFSTALDDLIRQQLFLVRRQNAMRMRMTVIGILATLAAVFLGLEVFEIRAALLTTLIIVFSRMAGPFAQMQGQLLEVVRTLPAFESLQALKSELGAGSRARGDVAIAFGPVRFETVSYRHRAEPGDDLVGARGGVSDLTLMIDAGAFLGIAGPSGSGKTTFLDLLVGLYAPQSGDILVAGAPAPLHLSDVWRDQIAYVSQDSFMLNDTVEANLRWGRPQATDAEIEAALACAGADALVRNFPAALATVLGERGALVSGGERQRLAIARALIRKPRLLILDEATNAIDIVSERQILANLKAMTPELSIVIVAHRAESLAFCDTICLMENGAVAERGSYRHLRERLVLSERESSGDAA